VGVGKVGKVPVGDVEEDKEEPIIALLMKR
jgi:hypothetical protein